MTSSDDPPTENRAAAADHRLYVPHPEGWQVKIKEDSDKEYCYFKNPGEDYFHLLLYGEIYVQFGTDKYCLNCALRLGKLTLDRLFWQRHGTPEAARDAGIYGLERPPESPQESPDNRGIGRNSGS